MTSTELVDRSTERTSIWTRDEMDAFAIEAFGQSVDGRLSTDAVMQAFKSAGISSSYEQRKEAVKFTLRRLLDAGRITKLQRGIYQIAQPDNLQ